VKLAGALRAWDAGDAVVLVSECMKAAGADGILPVTRGEETTVRGVVRGFAVFAHVSGDGALVIEAPVARLPRTQYVPALRLLSELSDRDHSPVRFSVRGELVLARYVSTVAATPPAAMTELVDLVAAAALDAARMLVGGLQARSIAAAEHSAMSPDSVKKGGARRHDADGMLDRKTPIVEISAVPSASDGIPAVLLAPQHAFSGGAAAPLRGKVPTPARVGVSPHMRSPAPGAGALGNVRAVGGAPPALRAPTEKPRLPPPPLPTRPAMPAVGGMPLSGPATRPMERRPPTSATAATTPAHPRVTAADSSKTMVSPNEAASDPNIDPLGDTFIGREGATKAPTKSGGPGDGLCELLHKAQTIGAVLSFADQPATMCLLIRATVYRAILDHEKEVPAAVAHLFHETASQTKEIFITAPGKRRGAMAIPAASPAFEVMARLVTSSAEVDPGPSLAVTPITTSQDAKQHLARYVSEIDQAPSDPDLRHFLALGALAELLVRTKLPGPTQDKLRGILTHAKKEGPKQSVVELMMTALTRMMA